METSNVSPLYILFVQIITIIYFCVIINLLTLVLTLLLDISTIKDILECTIGNLHKVSITTFLFADRRKTKLCTHIINTHNTIHKQLLVKFVSTARILAFCKSPNFASIICVMHFCEDDASSDNRSIIFLKICGFRLYSQRTVYY